MNFDNKLRTFSLNNTVVVHFTVNSTFYVNTDNSNCPKSYLYFSLGKG